MFKNITARRLSFYTSSIISLIFLVVQAVLVLSNVVTEELWVLGLSTLLVFIISYLVVLYFVKNFIFRKIKLIYKNIRNFRVSKGQEEKFNSKLPFFEKVETDVSNWSKEQQKQIEDLKSLENYRRDYIGNVAHELKTPAFNIQGYVHTLLDGAIEDTSVRDKYLMRASQNVERLIVILEDLDAITKLESGKMLLEKRNFNIKDIVLEVFEEFELRAKEKDITLSFKDGADKEYYISADDEAIRQVLSNLIANSIKYGRKGGETKISFYDMENYILVEVSDNGIGVQEKHLKHLFDRFYRVDKSRSRSEGGSGLGLSIVKHILEAHGETITVRSSPDIGTTFSFTVKKAD